jgi:hypothetical protein
MALPLIPMFRPRHLRRRRPVTGLHLDHVPQAGLAELDRAVAAVGRVDVVHWFQAWGGDAVWHPEWVETITATGRRSLVTWEPWSYAMPGVEWSPERIVAGDHDAYISAWAAAAAGPHPVWLRPMHEMNGTWYPWAGGDPATYIAAWRRIHRLVREAGAINVYFLWCPLVDDVAGPFEHWYPGARCVDVLGLDGYNWGAEFPQYGGWRTPATLFGTAYTRICRLGGQPVWLAEVGCAPEGGDKAAWCTDLYRLCGETQRIQAIVWFSLDKERDWRVGMDPVVAAAIRNR